MKIKHFFKKNRDRLTARTKNQEDFAQELKNLSLKKIQNLMEFSPFVTDEKSRSPDAFLLVVPPSSDADEKEEGKSC